MRTIRKFPPPARLTEWRLPRMQPNRPPATECNYGALRSAPEVLAAVEDGLFAEQGGICAYTGHRICLTPAGPISGTARAVDFHIEHLTPQKFCKPELGTYGKDADYPNLVACWPRPNCGFEPAYGAKKKDHWPAPDEEPLFISPLKSECSSRFKFNHRGEITAARVNDTPAETTIKKLGLDDPALTQLRREAIRGALNPGNHQIKLTEAKKLLAQMQQEAARLNAGNKARLLPFCFAIEPALQREIKKLEGIMNHP